MVISKTFYNLCGNLFFMEGLNLPPFYIGQRVEYIDVVDGIIMGGKPLKKGDKVTVVGVSFEKGWTIRNEKLWFIEIDIAIGYLYSAKDFVPIEENFQSISLEKILEEETKLISVN